MARTKKPSNAINLLRKTGGFDILDDGSFAVFAVNEAVNQMWLAYPWPQSLDELVPFYMTPNESDIVYPLGAVPSDFLALWEVEIQSTTRGASPLPLEIRRSLGVSAFTGQPTTIAYMEEIGPGDQQKGFRVHPTPSEGWGPPHYHVIGIYKKTPTAFTGDTVATTVLPFDDLFFTVYLEALRYQYYNLLGDPRAGRAQWQNGSIAYDGQLAKFQAALREATQQFSQLEGEVRYAPESTLYLG